MEETKLQRQKGKTNLVQQLLKLHAGLLHTSLVGRVDYVYLRIIVITKICKQKRKRCHTTKQNDVLKTRAMLETEQKSELTRASVWS